jgi:A/G-specific adenine glycosylase
VVVPGDQLTDWFAGRARDLPWRRTRDPWAVLVSEVMLQQTQVARVVPIYNAFLERFPTPAACAAAPAGDVVRAWAGLGYNRRAVNLHRTATAVVERHGGRLPLDLDALQHLPGIGPYTARAVLAFAAEADVGVVDVNVARVLARAVAGRPLTRSEVQAIADALVPRGRAWTWNSALLDLGATVCTASRPGCEAACPISTHCAWRAKGRPEPDPSTSPRQSAFAGSDRQGRGRLVDALREGPVQLSDASAVAGWPTDPDRTARVIRSLVDDGLAVLSSDGSRLLLP